MLPNRASKWRRIQTLLVGLFIAIPTACLSTDRVHSSQSEFDLSLNNFFQTPNEATFSGLPKEFRDAILLRIAFEAVLKRAGGVVPDPKDLPFLVRGYAYVLESDYGVDRFSIELKGELFRSFVRSDLSPMMAQAFVNGTIDFSFLPAELGTQTVALLLATQRWTGVSSSEIASVLVQSLRVSGGAQISSSLKGDNIEDLKTRALSDSLCTMYQSLREGSPADWSDSKHRHAIDVQDVKRVGFIRMLDSMSHRGEAERAALESDCILLRRSDPKGSVSGPIRISELAKAVRGSLGPVIRTLDGMVVRRKNGSTVNANSRVQQPIQNLQCDDQSIRRELTLKSAAWLKFRDQLLDPRLFTPDRRKVWSRASVHWISLNGSNCAVVMELIPQQKTVGFWTAVMRPPLSAHRVNFWTCSHLDDESSLFTCLNSRSTP